MDDMQHLFLYKMLFIYFVIIFNNYVKKMMNWSNFFFGVAHSIYNSTTPWFIVKNVVLIINLNVHFLCASKFGCWLVYEWSPNFSLLLSLLCTPFLVLHVYFYGVVESDFNLKWFTCHCIQFFFWYFLTIWFWLFLCWCSNRSIGDFDIIFWGMAFVGGGMHAVIKGNSPVKSIFSLQKH